MEEVAGDKVMVIRLPVLKWTPKELERDFGQGPGETGQGEWLHDDEGVKDLVIPKRTVSLVQLTPHSLQNAVQVIRREKAGTPRLGNTSDIYLYTELSAPCKANVFMARGEVDLRKIMAGTTGDRAKPSPGRCQEQLPLQVQLKTQYLRAVGTI
ncbi:hypothetical protein DUI87_11144 [Hirundo rustica rustica]|uniref:Uncharacterized protein n=1 Tax=Hirundo rustica rustica TaxID=333673 RepID=A0A3M0KHD2_HIRRU|nr:hypothetical protein DUI87_11144 [Hirundo rustica rustica]